MIDEKAAKEMFALIKRGEAMIAERDAKISELLIENGKLRESIKSVIDNSANQFTKATAPLIERLIRALCFYADEKNYLINEKYQDGNPELSEVSKDKGEIARNAMPEHHDVH